MTTADFIALGKRISFGGGLASWMASVEITPDEDGVRIRTKKLVLDRAMTSMEEAAVRDAHKEVKREGREKEQVAGVIGGDYFVSAQQLSRMNEDSARRRLLFFVRDSMIHEVDESIRWDGKIVNDPHAEDEAA